MIFVLEVVTALVTVLLVRDLIQHHEGLGFTFQIVLWLWFTVLFANFAEAVAEGRGKAQADTLRRSRVETRAKTLRIRKSALASRQSGRSICGLAILSSSRPATSSPATATWSKASPQ